MKIVITHALLLASLVVAVAQTADAPALTNPPPATVTLHDFKLAGDLNGERAVFTLTATARVENRKGGSIELLSGNVALTELSAHPKWRVLVDQNRFVLSFDRGGEFPIQVRFSAAVRQSEGWKAVDFRVDPSALQPVVLQGMEAERNFSLRAPPGPIARATTSLASCHRMARSNCRGKRHDPKPRANSSTPPKCFPKSASARVSCGRWLCSMARSCKAN